MAKRIIRTGTTADPTGDSLKNAFVKVNDNFTELYNALGLDADTLNIGAFEFTGSVMTTTDSSSIVIDQATTITSNLSVGGDIVPQTANGGDLGSSTLPWRSLYVSNNTIYIGGTAVGIDANGSLTTGGTVVGSTPAWNSITGKPTLFSGSYNDLTNKPSIPTSFNSLVNGAYSVAVESTGAFKVNAQSIVSENQLAIEGDGLVQLQTANGGSWISVWNEGNTKEINLVLNDGVDDFQTWTFNTDRTLILPDDSRIKSATNIDIIIDTPDSSTFNWRFGADGDLTLPAGGDILDSTGTSVLGGSVSSLVNGVHTASLGSTGILTLSNGAIATPVDNNVTINTSATVTTNNSFTNTEDFSTDVDLGDGIGVIAGWYQRNSEQIEFALFGPSSFQTYLTGLALGRTVIVTYSTSGGNQTLTRTLTQAFTATGQFDPANPTWGRVSGRIDATLPAGQTGIVRINFPVYSTSSKTLTFGADGSLTLPATGSLSAGSIYFNGSLQTGSQSQYQFEEIVDEGGPSPVYYSKLSLPNIAEIFAGDELSLSTWGSELAVRVRNPSDFSDHTWSFGNNGSLTLPGALTFPSGGGNIRSEGDINIDINLADSTKRIWRFGEDGNLETPGGIQVAGILKIDDGVHEQFQLKADATGTVTHDCSSGHIFYHTSPDANWTANFTNLNLDSTYATSVTLIIVQGATGYYPSAVQIGGAAQTINWQGNVNPTVSTSRTDVVTFSIINNSGTYTVLGQLTGF